MVSQLRNPSTDVVLRGLEAAALEGGEYGPYHDKGVLSVTRQILETGGFDPNPIAAAHDIYTNSPLAVIYTPAERAEAAALVARLGLKPAEGAQFARGVQMAEIALKVYSRSKQPTARPNETSPADRHRGRLR
jgi:hypothetical protein